MGADSKRTKQRTKTPRTRTGRWARWLGGATAAGGGVALVLIALLPTVSATIVLTPSYNQGCNGNPYGSLVQSTPIGTDAKVLNGPTLTGGYLNSGVNGWQFSTTGGAVSSSQIQTAEWFMVGPYLPGGAPSCWKATGSTVSLSATWSVQMNPYLGANCTGGASAAASYDVFVVSNFHNSAGGYVISGISPHLTVDAMAIDCGSVPYAPGTQSFTVTVTTPLVTPGPTGAPFDFYSALWVYTESQVGTTGSFSSYSGVTWEASLTQVVCNGC